MDSKRIVSSCRIACVAACVLVLPSMAGATPSTTYWAPSVATCQASSVPHVTYDTYYGKGPVAGTAGAPNYPIDTGLTVGVLPGNKVQAEVGYDLLLPSQNPIQFYVNGKICVTENSLFNGAPAVSFGFWNVGFKKDVTDYNALHLMFQKALPFGGYVAAGLYHGMSDVLFTNSEGKIVKTGAMIGAAAPDIKVGLKGLDKIVIIGDIQTGKNVLGAGGVGATVYFSDKVSLIVGPVFYLDKAIQPGGKGTLWTTQLDIDIPIGK